MDARGHDVRDHREVVRHVPVVSRDAVHEGRDLPVHRQEVGGSPREIVTPAGPRRDPLEIRRVRPVPEADREDPDPVRGGDVDLVVRAPLRVAGEPVREEDLHPHMAGHPAPGRRGERARVVQTGGARPVTGKDLLVRDLERLLDVRPAVREPHRLRVSLHEELPPVVHPHEVGRRPAGDVVHEPRPEVLGVVEIVAEPDDRGPVRRGHPADVPLHRVDPDPGGVAPRHAPRGVHDEDRVLGEPLRDCLPGPDDLQVDRRLRDEGARRSLGVDSRGGGPLHGVDVGHRRRRQGRVRADVRVRARGRDDARDLRVPDGRRGRDRDEGHDGPRLQNGHPGEVRASVPVRVREGRHAVRCHEVHPPSRRRAPGLELHVLGVAQLVRDGEVVPHDVPEIPEALPVRPDPHPREGRGEVEHPPRGDGGGVVEPVVGPRTPGGSAHHGVRRMRCAPARLVR